MLLIIIQHLAIVVPSLGAIGLLIRQMFAMHRRKGEAPAPKTRGAVIRWPRVYNLILWVFMRGREAEIRQKIADLAQLRGGEAVLDVGCGSGTLALLARERVGATGRVCAIDPSREMIVYARRKANLRHLSIDFQRGIIEQLAFPEQSFDVVLCTWMIHHIPGDLQRRGLQEIARVLKPGGRLLLVDSNLRGLPLKEAGFTRLEDGQFQFPSGVDFVLAHTDPPEDTRPTSDASGEGQPAFPAQVTLQEIQASPFQRFHDF